MSYHQWCSWNVLEAKLIRTQIGGDTPTQLHLGGFQRCYVQILDESQSRSSVPSFHSTLKELCSNQDFDEGGLWDDLRQSGNWLVNRESSESDETVFIWLVSSLQTLQYAKCFSNFLPRGRNYSKLLFFLFFFSKQLFLLSQKKKEDITENYNLLQLLNLDRKSWHIFRREASVHRNVS